jgi:(S)-ureidoglycine aminohydrolase
MTTVEFEPGGTLTQGPVQRLVFVLEGEISLFEPANETPHSLRADGYAFCPQGFDHSLRAETKSRVVLVEKYFRPLDQDTARSIVSNDQRDQPWFLFGSEKGLPATPLNGDSDLLVRALLPDSIAFDFACNTMTYAPGAGLSQVEIHYMEHGLLMLEGGGIYRLGDQWYPTQAGDFIWMAPFCPQWFGAIGKQPAKYLIYKDFNRHTLA